MARRASTGNSVRNTSLVLTKPAGTVDGDVVVLYAINDAAADAITFPAGFAALASSPLQNTFDSQRCAAAWKVAASEPASWTVTCPSDVIGGAVSFSGRSGVLTASSGLSTGATGAASPAACNATGLTAAAGDDLFWICGSDNDSGVDVTFTAPSGFTIDQDLWPGSADFRNLGSAYRDNFAGGATGTVTGTATFASGSAARATFLLAFAAAGGGGGGTQVPYQPNYQRGPVMAQ